MLCSVRRCGTMMGARSVLRPLSSRYAGSGLRLRAYATLLKRAPEQVPSGESHLPPLFLSASSATENHPEQTRHLP